MPDDSSPLLAPHGVAALPDKRQVCLLYTSATLGTVISPDLNRLAQMQPNQKARFVAVSLEEGLEARRRYNWQVQRLQHFFLR